MRAPLKLIPFVITGAIALGACGDGGSTDTADSSGGSTAVTAAAQTRVSANDASRDEIAAAIATAGVDSADRWAGEVVEYRPYSSQSDAARLREELAKYGPDDATLDRILSALAIP